MTTNVLPRRFLRNTVYNVMTCRRILPTSPTLTNYHCLEQYFCTTPTHSVLVV